MALLDKVGTIKLTIRTDLGDKWLLCNGDLLNREDYPELSPYFPNGPSNPWVTVNGTFSQNFCIGGAYGNGYYIMVVQSSPNIIIYYSQSVTGPWTSFTINTGFSQVSIQSVQFVNGYFILCGNIQNAGNYFPYLWYATSPTSWSGTNMGVTGQSSYNQWATSVTYLNGYYYAAYYYTYDGGSYVKRSSSLSGTWGSFSSRLNGTITVLRAFDGKIYYGRSYDSYVYAGYLYSSAQVYETQLVTSGGEIGEILYNNGEWIFVGHSGTIAYLWHGATYDSLTAKTLWTSDTNSFYVKDVIHDENGNYLVCGSYVDGSTTYGRIAYSSDLDGTWTFVDMDFTGITSYSYNAVRTLMMAEDGIYLAVTTVNYAYTDPTKFLLPEIAPSNFYAYIKALEG